MKRCIPLLLTFLALAAHAGEHISGSGFPGRMESKSAEKTLWQPYFITPRSGDRHVSLSGVWDLSYRDTPIGSLADLKSQSKWVHASVPNSIQWALYEAGELPNPYEFLNSKQYTWIPDKVWYYRRTFTSPSLPNAQYVFLCLDGAGYYSRIWLNGNLLGRHEGMFEGPEIEISSFLTHSGLNDLVIEVKAGSYGVEHWDPNHTGKVILPWGIAGGHPSVTGKSGISPKEFQPFGLWRDVRLEIVPRIQLERPFLTTKAVSLSEAELELKAELLVNRQSLQFQLHPWGDDILNNFSDGSTAQPVQTPLELTFELREKKSDAVVLAQHFPVSAYDGRNFIQERIRVPSPQLWWPNGMGDAHLYTVKLILTNQGQALDNIEFDFGIREIHQIASAGPRTQDRWANWQFVVNHRPLFIKGVNWAWPTDVLMHLPRDRYSWQLRAAQAAGVQMLRVWGGGYPETEDFYSLCDQLGIMVWEDFSMANSDTPDWPQDVWEAQVVQTIFRLRNHPSLTVWSGGNEFNPYSFGNTASSGIIERSVTTFDGTRMFTRTSPDPGDLHPYPEADPTWFSRLYRFVPFVGEMGTMGLSNADTLREVIHPEELSPPLKGIFSPEFTAARPEFVHHFLQYEDTWVMKGMFSRASQFDDISAPSLDRLTEAAELATAEFDSMAVELLEGNYPVTTGVMPWAFTVPWPIMFPQWLDYFGQATPTYYFMKRVYEPTHVVIQLPQLLFAVGEKIPASVAVIHASRAPLNNLNLSVRVLDPTFHPLWSQSRRIGLKPGPSVENLNLGGFEIPSNFEDKFFFVLAELRRQDGSLVSRSVDWPRCLKLMADAEFLRRYRASPQETLRFDHGPWLRPQVERQPTSLNLTLLSHQSAQDNESLVQVEVRNTGTKPSFLTRIEVKGTKRGSFGSDNYFWLAPGEARRLDLHVLWLEPAKSDHAILSLSSWNADEESIRVPIRRVPNTGRHVGDVGIGPIASQAWGDLRR